MPRNFWKRETASFQRKLAKSEKNMIPGDDYSNTMRITSQVPRCLHERKKGEAVFVAGQKTAEWFPSRGRRGPRRHRPRPANPPRVGTSAALPGVPNNLSGLSIRNPDAEDV